MSQTCPTVTIIRNGVEVRINESDYNPKVDKLAGKTPVTPPMPPQVKPVDEMSATELREYAKENDIDVKGLKSREDLLNAVKGGEDENELFVMPTADGKFEVIDSEGASVDGELYETHEDAEKAIHGE